LAHAASIVSGNTASDQQLAAQDGLDVNSFYMEADTLADDDASKTVTASGHVQARYRGRTLRADEVTYNSQTGDVTARGHVVIVNPDGTSEFATETALNGDLKTGVALGFSARLQQNVKIAANSVVRRNEDVAELNQAIYTPCNICTQSGGHKQPTWSIQASHVVRDSAHHVIYYRNAVIRVLGVPVFYAPIFWNPDAGTEARSGFLAPRIEFSHKRGFSYEQPYVVAISPSQDLVLSPILNTQVNPFLNTEYRLQLQNGRLDVRGGYTYEREFDVNGNPIPGSDLTSRSYILASGDYNFTDKFSGGFAAERVSDPLLFDRYDIQNVYARRGLFESDTRRLLSQVYAIRQDDRSYLSISALDFQGLRIGDVNAAMPVVAPLIEGRYEPAGAVFGGRLRIQGSAVFLQRKADIYDPSLPGTDSRRATGEVDWRGVYTLRSGIRIEPFLNGRVDVYHLSDVPPDFTSKSVGRLLGDAGVDLSYPLIKTTGSATIVLEPLLEGIAAPDAKPNTEVPNLDSAHFVFDETNLFDPNRAPGFDIYDSGMRLNVGGRATVDWGSGHILRAFLGRSFREKLDITLPPDTGFTNPASDWIFAATATPMTGLTVYTRTQLDGGNLSFRREEAGVSAAISFAHGYIRYLKDKTNLNAEIETVEGSGDVFVTKHWGVVGYLARDLQNNIWARRDFGIVYQDECARIEVVYHYQNADVRLGGASSSVLVRLTLATLGDQRYRNRDEW
jgi:LPS-assembly protein